MTSAQALRRAIKLFGKTAAVRDDGKKRASTPADRGAAKEAFKALREQCLTPEARKEHRKELENLSSQTHRYRFSVGRIMMGMFFEVKACGDSWEGCFNAFAKDSVGTAYE